MTHDPLVPYRYIRQTYPGVGSRMTIKRRLDRNEFPYPAATLGGQRHWSLSDIKAWNAGKRSGWKPTHDPSAAERAAKGARARAGKVAAKPPARPRSRKKADPLRSFANLAAQYGMRGGEVQYEMFRRFFLAGMKAATPQ